MELEKLQKEIGKGDFRRVKEFLEKNGNKSNLVPINILITTCKLTRTNDINISKDDLFNTAVLCCERFTDLDENETKKLLMSLYHIIKFYFSKLYQDELRKISKAF